MLRTTLIGGAAALLILPPSVHAQSSSGTITGAYDADDATWTIAENGEGFPASGWIDREDGLNITLVGRPGPNGLGDGGTLVMEFTMDGTPQELRVVEPTVWMATSDEGDPLMAGPENIDLSVTALERGGDEVAIAGDIVAALSPGGSGELTIQSEETVVIDGNFQATLARLDSNE